MKEDDLLKKWISFISTRLREFRESKKLSVSQLERRSGVPAEVIRRIEKGEHSPSELEREKLGRALGRSLEWHEEQELPKKPAAER